MTHEPLIAEIERWLIAEALADPRPAALYAGLCARLHAAGVPVARGYLAWPTLHPLYDAEQVIWRVGAPLLEQGMPHSDTLEPEFLTSPLWHVISNDLSTFRRRLEGPEAAFDFPVLAEFREEGFTDYLIQSASFGLARLPPISGRDSSGLIVSWTTARPGGFSDADLAAFARLLQPFAVAMRASLQNTVLANLADAYLGPSVGARVLAGAIRRGDGERIRAAIWYADLRRSTQMARALGPDAYLELLNGFFEASAGAVIEAGGEVLAFIGDAVLAVFPHDGDARRSALAATAATDAAVARAAAIRGPGGAPIGYGVAIGEGEAVFGNIGVPQRLSFTVIGEAVNAVQRIERHGKAIGEPVLATAAIAAAEPEGWRPVGAAALTDIEQPVALYARR